MKATAPAPPAPSSPPSHRPAAARTSGAIALALMGVLLSPLVAHGADWSLSATQVEQGEADLDGGGRTELSSSQLAASLSAQAGDRLRIGAGLRLEHEDWSFEAPAAFGSVAPWDDVRRAGLGLQLHYALRPDWHLTLAPNVQMAAERGADRGEAMSYGLALAGTRVFAPDRRFGLGLVVLRDIEDTRVLPYVALAWRLNAHWTLANPAAAGPAGVGGLELAYDPGEHWTLAFGAGYRRQRFRLDDDGPYGKAVAESRGAPVYARVSYAFRSRLRFDLYAGALLAGELRVEEIPGQDDLREDYERTPLVGASVRLSL